ncbi:Sensor histidine kinase GlnK [Geobacillus sp. TFV-3]|nr:Sensor histidine kinase GlnK [Geobacillus sp. TFV-3]
MVVRANEKYTELVKKEIAFQLTCDLDLSTRHVYALLSVLNNLVANAVEAIPLSGWIHLRAELDGGDLVFTVTQMTFARRRSCSRAEAEKFVSSHIILCFLVK